MKKLITTALATMVAVYGYAQNTYPFPQSGNVGIGTTNPQSALDVAGEIRSTNAGSNLYWAYMKANWAENNVFELGLSGHKIITSDNYYYGSALNFWTADTKKMTISSSGNVGIGTTTPGAKQEIFLADGGLNQFRLNTGFTGGNYIDINPFIKDVNNGGFSISQNGSVRFVIDNSGNGNVGIGTTTPDSKLTVAGKIHSQEVKVSIAAGADFVFQKDYKLTPLADVAAFISTNKHLPQIASADEMKRNGLELGEMNIKLLQKIEELTLYLIEIKEELNALKAQKSKSQPGGKF